MELCYEELGLTAWREHIVPTLTTHQLRLLSRELATLKPRIINRDYLRIKAQSPLDVMFGRQKIIAACPWAFTLWQTMRGQNADAIKKEVSDGQKALPDEATPFFKWVDAGPLPEVLPVLAKEVAENIRQRQEQEVLV